MGALQQVIAAGGASPSTLLDNLVAYWKLDEASGTRVDATGRGNDLADNNTVASDTGKISSAALFVAANSEYLSRASNADLMPSGDFTVAAWVNLAGGFGGAGQIVSKDSDAVGSRDYNLDIASSQPRFYLRGADGGLATHPTSLSTSTWYHIIAWYDSAGPSVNIVLNAGATTSSATTAPWESAAQFRIGARVYAGFEGYLDGRVDEVGLWHRILTAGERTALYNGGAGLTYPF